MRSAKVKILFGSLLAILLLGPLSGQQKDTLITINLTERRFEEVLDQITSISGMGFSYNPTKINRDTLISIHFINATLSDILNYLTKYGVNYKILDDHIVLKRNRRIVSSFSPGPEITLSGYIKNKSSGEVLIGATIGDPSVGYGAASNEFGFYSLTIDTGHYEMVCSYIGFESYKFPLKLESNIELDILLSENTTQINEVLITENSAEKIIEDLGQGKISIRPGSIQQIPGILGESDVIKSIQVLPGISFFSDGSTIFHVRGGDRDQNLILIDDAPIYNPAHMLGMFSAFTPESINSINIYRGDMPSVYGGRLSSVIDIRLKDGNSNSLVFSGNTGPLATTLNLEGPMFKDKSSFYLSARRSHLKWILDVNNVNVNKLYFTDLNLKYNFRINRKNRILFSYYSGLDMFRNKNSQNSSNGISWENNAGNLRWNHLFNDQIFINTGLIISNYDYNLFTSWEEKERWNTGIGLLALKSDFSYYQSKGSIYRTGFYFATHFYSPGNYYIGNLAQAVTRGVSARKARENAIYFSNENNIGLRTSIRYGLRFTRWANVGAATEYSYNDLFFPVDTINHAENEVYNVMYSFEPRVALVYRIGENSSAKLSWSKNAQFEYLISNSVSPFTSLEAWLPASPNIKQMKSNQITAGLSLTVSDRRIIVSAEMFYKIMDNYMEYVDHAYMLFNPHVEAEIRYGQGESYGGELMLKVPEGRLNGWLSYSYTRTILEIPEINRGNPYPSVYDRPHTLNISLNYLALPSCNLSATWIYSSGSPITTPSGFYYYNGYQVPFYDKRNNDRLPNYHRLDLAAEFRLNKSGTRYTHSLRLSVLNAYGRKNPFSVNFNKIITEHGKIVVPSDHYSSPDVISSMMYIYGTIPSISYKFSF